jgi:predicted RND superfamily exporter protein
MKTPLLSRRVPLFGTIAMVILCAAFFLVPFLVRGARMGIDHIENKVADWLPPSYPETQDLIWFRDHFIGDQFVVVSWPGCTEEDSRFQLLVDKIYRESVKYGEDQQRLAESLPEGSPERIALEEEIRAHEVGDRLGLQTTGDYHEDWGKNNERWLMGRGGVWYFIDRQGGLYRWDGQNNVVEGIKRGIERFLTGTNKVDGLFIDQFGDPDNNEFYADPSKLFARFFTGVTTGPGVFNALAGPQGTLLVGDYARNDRSSFEAQIEAHKRLTGVLFGPTPSPEFDWTINSLLAVIPEEKRALIDEDRKFEFQEFVNELVAKYNGDINALRKAPPNDQLEYWYRLWDRMQLPPPPRQTALVVTLNDSLLDELDRIVGRPVLGKPRGRLLELATGQCGITPNNLHLGGPPVDNVAIDEEGSITLFRLVGVSAVIGMALSYLCFRSIRVTMMVLFVGGMSAIGSLAIVWFGGSRLDAILMTMPSLIYVLGLSGAVHIVNYYRDEMRENGDVGAAERAIRRAIMPCTLAAFTTSLGLISLFSSDLTPIRNFGIFSSIATMASLAFLYTFLPAALTVWPPGYTQPDAASQRRSAAFHDLVERFWQWIGERVIRWHWVVSGAFVALFVVFAFGVMRVETTVQLLKLFRSNAKILSDYRWMEENLGKLVPMELVISVDRLAQSTTPQLADAPADGAAQGAEPAPISDREALAYDEGFPLLERLELSSRVRRHVLDVFGPVGLDVIGSSMSTDVATPLELVVKKQLRSTLRMGVNSELEAKYKQLLEQDYLRLDASNGGEMWRISLRLAALNNIDYGQFVAELKTVVEPIMWAYQYRTEIVRTMHTALGAENLHRGEILVLGPSPKPIAPPSEAQRKDYPRTAATVDQTNIFALTLVDLLQNAGYTTDASQKRMRWLDPAKFDDDFDQAVFAKLLASVDCVVLVADHPRLDVDFIRGQAANFVDVRNHGYQINPRTKEPLPGQLTAAERKAQNPGEVAIITAYTGIVPIVYKAQRALLHSLISSTGMSFVAIALTMAVLMRNWRRPWSVKNSFNLPGGLVLMLPNVFPVVAVFGAMGYLGSLVDIGSMMTASVAMGIAVDDTIHFMTWYREGLAEGLPRRTAILTAYRKCATAMTQTAMIAGLGLASFAFSTFMPTQRFGVMMLCQLFAALFTELLWTPALLASPLGRFFENVQPPVSTGGHQTPPGAPQTTNGAHQNASAGEVASEVLAAGSDGAAVAAVRIPHPHVTRPRAADGAPATGSSQRRSST